MKNNRFVGYIMSVGGCVFVAKKKTFNAKSNLFDFFLFLVFSCYFAKQTIIPNGTVCVLRSFLRIGFWVRGGKHKKKRTKNI